MEWWNGGMVEWWNGEMVEWWCGAAGVGGVGGPGVGGVGVVGGVVGVGACEGVGVGVGVGVWCCCCCCSAWEIWFEVWRCVFNIVAEHESSFKRLRHIYRYNQLHVHEYAGRQLTQA